MMYIGYALLGILAVVILIGLLNGVFARMGLKKYVALLIVVAIIAGAIIPSIWIGTRFSFSIGGFLIPFLLCIYLMVLAARHGELWRCILAELVSAAAVFVVIYFIPVTTTALSIMLAIAVGLLSGAIGYLIARSSRAAFASAVMGIILAEVAVFVINSIRGLTPTLSLGIGGMFSAIIISGITAVVLAEAIGAVKEGSEKAERREAARRQKRDILLHSEQAEFHGIDEFRDDDRI